MEGWQLADNPPSTGRLVMLRFAPHGRKSTVAEQIGFFWRVSGGALCVSERRSIPELFVPSYTLARIEGG